MEKRLRERLGEEKESADAAKIRVEELEKKLKVVQRNLNQRRIAMESMREGVHAQRDRLAEIQVKVKNQAELEKNLKEMKATLDRKSSESFLEATREAERTYKEVGQIAKLKAQLSQKDVKVKGNRI